MEKRYKLSQDITFKACQEFMFAGNKKKYKLLQDITFKEGDEFTLGVIEEIPEPWATDEDILNLIGQSRFYYPFVGASGAQTLIDEYKMKNKI